MKTKQLRQFYKSVSRLNNALSHYAFVWEQFILDHSEKIKAHPQKLTTEVFTKNLSSNRHNVQLSTLNDSHENAKVTILRSIFLLSYGFFEQYLIGLHQLAQQVDSSILDLQQRKDFADEPDDGTILVKFLLRIGIQPDSCFNAQELSTMDFIRLRRNRVSHGSEKAQGRILEIINHEGTNLNKYWDERLAGKRQKLDFKVKNVDDFEVDEVIDLLNILRRLAENVDKAFVKKITEIALIKQELLPYIESHRGELMLLTEERRKLKFRSYVRSKYGYVISGNMSEFDLTVV